MINNPLPSIGIIIGILVLRPLKGGGLLIVGLHYWVRRLSLLVDPSSGIGTNYWRCSIDLDHQSRSRGGLGFRVLGLWVLGLGFRVRQTCRGPF